MHTSRALAIYILSYQYVQCWEASGIRSQGGSAVTDGDSASIHSFIGSPIIVENGGRIIGWVRRCWMELRASATRRRKVIVRILYTVT